jgi:glycosyltransferase involved in cell wall biosynthesis
MPGLSAEAIDDSSSSGASRPVLSVVLYFIEPAPYLEEALLSVVAQLTPAVELVVVAGHTPDTMREIPSVLRARIDILIAEPDRGAWDAANKGWRAARGTWIQFLMSDDWLPEGSLARTLAALPTHEGDEILSGGMSFVGSEGRPQRVIPGQTLSLERVLDNVSSPAVIFRRDLLERLGGFDSRFPIAHDRELLLRAWQSGARHAVLPHETYRMRVHAGSRTTSGDRRVQLAYLRDHVEFADAFLATCPLPPSKRHRVQCWRDEELTKYRVVRWLAGGSDPAAAPGLSMHRFAAALLRIARRRLTGATHRF